MINKSEIELGISAYIREQKVFLRLLRRYGSFTEKDFDRLFRGREYRRPMKAVFFTSDTLILGMGLGGHWAVMLDLLQYMILLGKVRVKKVKGTIVYYEGERGLNE